MCVVSGGRVVVFRRKGKAKTTTSRDEKLEARRAKDEKKEAGREQSCGGLSRIPARRENKMVNGKTKDDLRFLVRVRWELSMVDCRLLSVFLDFDLTKSMRKVESTR